MSTATDVQWDLEYRPRRLRRLAVAVAVVIIAIHITFGALLTIADTGPKNIGLDDQLAIALIGTLEAGAVLLLTRARLRAGAAGVAVRNLGSDRLFTWDRVEGLAYPEKGWSAWLLLPADEHIPVVAVQAWDGDRAVSAMTRFRELEQRYRTPGVT
ncbi:PH domain-containing protein [Gordonia sp. NPDC003424]